MGRFVRPYRRAGPVDPRSAFSIGGDTGSAALVPYGDNPLTFHWSRSRTALATNNHPTESVQVQLAHVLQQRFDRQKSHGSIGLTQVIDTRKSVLSIFDTYAPPNMGLLCGKFERRTQKSLQALGPLRKDLVGMPPRVRHDPGNGTDIVVRHCLMEQIAH